MLALLIVSYPLLASIAARPLSVFALPALVTAVLAGWRSTTLVGIVCVLTAVVAGLLGTLAAGPLVVRWGVLAVTVAVAATGAAIRERQSVRLVALNDAIDLREAFERALAPLPVPPPNFAAVAAYRPAESRMGIGGDFLEAVAVADGRLAVLMGDVCGHGPREAAFGAALRAGWKSIALGGNPEPGEWVRALDNAFFKDGRIDTYVTLCTGYLDLAAGCVRLVNVAHPPAVVVHGPARELDVPPAPPLGLGLNDHWTTTTYAWDGTPLLLYTDGLVDNPKLRGTAQRWDIDGLLGWLDLQPAGLALETLSGRLLTAATAGRDLRDDVATLLVGANARQGASG